MELDHDLGRVPPHSEKAEQALLASILTWPKIFSEIIDIVAADDFYRLRHKAIFTAILELQDTGETPDIITLSDYFSTSGTLDSVGGMKYLSELFESNATSANATRYAKIIRERSVLRQLGECGSEMIESCFTPDVSIESVLDSAEKSIFALSQKRDTRDYYDMKEIVSHAFTFIENLYEKKDQITGVPSGFQDVDNILTGFQKSDLVILAARPSMGKTAFCLNVIANAAIRHKAPVLFFSLEMSRIQLAIRLLCSEARVEGNKIRRGFISEEDWPHLTRAASELAEAPIYIDDTPGITIREMRSKSRRLAMEHGLSMIVVDYLQLMDGGAGAGGRSSRNEEISGISRGLKALARELSVPVIALSQLSRNVESRPDKRPMLSDLRDSGAIEQDADVVMFLYRDEYYNKEKSESKGIAELIVGKQRNGPVGTVMLTFMQEYTKFANHSFRHED